MPSPIAKSEMLIRVPVDRVFRAFTSRTELQKFWLADSSGDLHPGAVVQWTFLVPGAVDTITVTAFEPNAHLQFQWSDGGLVDVHFAEHTPGTTRVAVTATRFTGEDPPAQAVDATEGYTIVLCDLKCLLETGTPGHMARDKAALITAGSLGAGPSGSG